MFEIKDNEGFFIVDSGGNYLHSDGNTFQIYPERWPTKEDAQKVLDKFQPELKHVWVHGDVFRAANGGVMMYLHPEKKYRKRKPFVVYVGEDSYPYGVVVVYLINAKFLFNIGDKI